MFLEMADDGLNGGTPFELALDLRREAALGSPPSDRTEPRQKGRKCV